MRAVRPEAGIDVEVRAANDGLRASSGREAEALARALTGDTGAHAVAFETEASNFQKAGHAVCVIGPGSIEQAHQADEFLTAAELGRATAFLRRLIARLAA